MPAKEIKWNEYKNKHQENKKSPPEADIKPSTQGMFKFSPAPDTDEYKLYQLGIR